MKSEYEKYQKRIKELEEQLSIVCSYLGNADFHKEEDKLTLNKSTRMLKDIIEQYLIDRPQNSKRKLCQEIGISHGRLYEYLGGKRLLSQAILERLGQVLHLTDEEEVELREKINEDRYNRKKIKQIYVKHAKNIDDTKDILELNSIEAHEWFAIKSHFHYLVLSHMCLKSYSGDIDWIVRHTGLEREFVQDILDDLLFGDLVKKDGNLFWRTKGSTFATTRSDDEGNHMRAFCLDQVEYNLSLVRNDPSMTKSFVNGFSFTGNSKKIKTAQVMLNELMLKVANYMDDGDENDAVYSLSLLCSETSNNKK